MKTVFATGGGPTVNVAPAVADHPALREVNLQIAGRAQKHSRFRVCEIRFRPRRNRNRKQTSTRSIGSFAAHFA